MERSHPDAHQNPRRERDEFNPIATKPADIAWFLVIPILFCLLVVECNVASYLAQQIH